jgi:hypothetical protein
MLSWVAQHVTPHTLFLLQTRDERGGEFMWCFLCCVQDYKGNWWVCPDFGYDAVACPSCEGPPMRCKSHYGLFFR